MSLHWPLIAFLLALGLPAAGAQADDGSSDTTEYKFDDTLVDGSMPSAKGEVLFVRKRAQRESLIRVREHWVRELLHSVENL